MASLDYHQLDHMKLCYFGMRSTVDGRGHIGSALVVDHKSLPVELRYSMPVRPSEIQRVLYGSQLYSHIAIDLCGQPLMHSLTHRPAMCLVESPSLLPLQEHLPVPVFLAERACSGAASDSESGDARRIDSPSGFAPVFLRCQPHWMSSLEGFTPLLERAFVGFDLLEPFDRLTAACELICQNDERCK